MRSLLDFTLAIWSDRCDTMHGVDGENTKRIIKEKAIKWVGEVYENNAGVEREYEYLFKEGLETLCKRSTQYIIK